MFMGGEFGQSSEWNFLNSLDWHLLDYDSHKGVKALVSDLNKVYRAESALFDKQFSPEGFEWLDTSDTNNCVVYNRRKGLNEDVLILLNLTPLPKDSYRIGVPKNKTYVEILNSDEHKYWGSGITNPNINTDSISAHGFDQSIQINLPPLGAVIIK